MGQASDKWAVFAGMQLSEEEQRRRRVAAALTSKDSVVLPDGHVVPKDELAAPRPVPITQLAPNVVD